MVSLRCSQCALLVMYVLQERAAAPAPVKMPEAAMPAAQPLTERCVRPQGVAKVDLSTAFGAAAAPQRAEPGPAQQIGRHGPGTARGSQPIAPSRLAKSSSAAAPQGMGRCSTREPQHVIGQSSRDAAC